MPPLDQRRHIGGNKGRFPEAGPRHVASYEPEQGRRARRRMEVSLVRLHNRGAGGVSAGSEHGC